MLEGRAIVHKTVTSTDVVIVTPASERGGHRVALAGPALLSWRSQPSGEWPTTSVGELNRIGEPKNPSVVHPPHSTVLRREEGKGIHIQLTDRNFIHSLNLFLFNLSSCI